ncbi:MAG: radical SAM protein, partial [Nanoarchaeota archaeon]
MLILFINPEDKYLNLTGGNKGDRAPLALGALSAYCKQYNYRTKIFDLNHDSKEELDNFIENEKPEFICFTVATPNYFQVLEMAKKFKKTNNILIAGGNHITDNPREQRTLDVFNYIILQDGEEALLRIIKERPKEQIINGGKSLDPNILPIPDYEGLKFERYFMTVEGKKGAVVITSRGCLYNCMYCGSAKLKKWRPRNPEHVMEELRLLYHRYNIRGFYFADDIALTPRKQDQERFIKICNIIKQEMPDVVFRVTTRADSLTDEVCKAMGEAGCKWVSLGVESG